jgi:hypothetical protein
MKSFNDWLNENNNYADSYYHILHISGHSAGSHGLGGSDEYAANPEVAFKNSYWNFSLEHKETEILLKNSPMIILFKTHGSFHEYFFEVLCYVKVSKDLVDKIKQIEKVDESSFEDTPLPGDHYIFTSLEDTIKIIAENYTKGIVPSLRGLLPKWANAPLIKPITKNTVKATSFSPKPGENKEDYWRRQIDNANQLKKRDYEGD